MATVTVGADTVPDRLDVVHLAGQQFELTLPILGSAGGGLDFSAVASARAQVRPSVDSDQILFTFSSESDPVTITITDVGGDAVLEFDVDSAVTDDWQVTWPGSAGRATVWWDVEIVDAEDVARQVTSPGTITLMHQVTR